MALSGRHHVALGVICLVAALVVQELLPPIYWIDVDLFWDTWRRFGGGFLPYRDFLWEFPPLTVPLVAPAAVLGREAFALWFTAVSVGCTQTALWLVCRAVPVDRHLQLLGWWLAVGAPVLVCAWFRFDALALVCAAAALVGLVERRGGAAATVAGALARLWPIAFVAGHLAQRRHRDTACALGGAAAAVALWWAWSPQGLADFVRFRQSVGFQLESSVGALAVLLGAGPPEVASGAWVVSLGAWDVIDRAATFGWLGVATALTLAVRRRGGDPVMLVGAVTASLLVSSRILSPQYLVWLLPFACLAAVRGDALTGRLAVAVNVLTFAALWDYRALVDGEVWAASLVCLRNLGLVVLAVRLAGAALVRPSGVVAPALPEGRPDRAGRSGERTFAPLGSGGWPTRSSSAGRASTT